ncbi:MULTISPECIES: hypothetical protein [unclassified Bradyrhizobium]|uniref:hypothetical protein n=1 Tax=unclassified Bradyrhizobium TaxID=2631580 RepID=UPI0024B168E5|nr:hypothetical protein [Bradyrhizobium sp. CB2312]WFU74986.1 hypothetical protein QA642_13595 [Bradyrhizobium sp. CB2312]
MAFPSIIPNDRLDKDFYLVLEEFRDGAAFRETGEVVTYSTLIGGLLADQYDQVLRVVAFIRSRGGRERPEDIARELERRIAAEGHAISDALRNFVESGAAWAMVTLTSGKLRGTGRGAAGR